MRQLKQLGLKHLQLKHPKRPAQDSCGADGKDGRDGKDGKDKPKEPSTKERQSFFHAVKGGYDKKHKAAAKQFSTKRSGFMASSKVVVDVGRVPLTLP